MSAAERFDAVVVGAGAGGLTVAVGLARSGRRVALVEAGEVGGDCTNVGCIPSKTLIGLARQVAALPPEERPGAAASALAETRARRDALRAHERAWLGEEARLTLVPGRARLAAGSAATPDVIVRTAAGDERRLGARRVVLATGSRPAVPPLPGLEAVDDGGPVSTHVTLFELARAPDHLAVLGAGAIGCELAFAFARLGSRVTLIEAAERPLPASEPEASAIVGARLEALGVRVHLRTRALGFDAAAGTLRVAPADAGDAAADVGREIERVAGVDRLLVAVGRRPSADDLGLEAVGVRRDARGAVVVDRAYRTSAPGVYAIGDVAGAASTHAANLQGRRLVRYLVAPLPLLPEGPIPTVAFTEPEVGQVGPTVAQLRRRWPAALLAVERVALADTDRGRTAGLRDGFVQLVALRGSGRLLAATVVAPDAGEMLPLLSWAVRRRASAWQLSRLVVAYPALGEAVRQAADAFVFRSLPRWPTELATYLRWRWRRPPRRDGERTVPSAPVAATPPDGPDL